MAQGSRKKKYIFLAIAIVVIASLWVTLTYWEKFNRQYEGETVWLRIPAGSDDNAVLDSLTTILGNNFGKAVHETWTIYRGEPAKARGAYLINKGDKAKEVARRLRNGSQTPMKVTFNNIRLFNELPPKFAHLSFSEKEFMEAAGRILPREGFDEENFIAAFVPDTYEFYWSTTADEAVKRLLDYHAKFWNEQRIAKADSLGFTPNEIVTIASIVDEETRNPQEKGVVARLYMNRLKKGMKLQADPTLKYAAGDFTIKRITNNLKEIDSPYNTYKFEGLPPGPIRMPDKTTVDAVLNAPLNDYLYMCAKEDLSGTHNFTANYKEHLANADRYHKALDRLGIK